MASIEKNIDVDVPVRTAYPQWTQFEEFPKFMEGVKEVQQLDDKHLRWKAVIGGKEKEWNAVIVDHTSGHSATGTSPGNALIGNLGHIPAAI